MKRRTRILFTLLLAGRLGAADGDEVIPHRQDKPPNKPYSPAEAIQHIVVPEGFSVEVVASEPDLVNPIAMTFDDRGRIWVTESVEYPRKPAGPGRDRVKLFQGTRESGYAEKVGIFADGFNIPTGIAWGYGGVWVLNSPDLLFLREKDGREAGREVVLTGFGRTDTHELPSSLTWGPDGWLYGLNGVFNQCRIRSSNGKEYAFNCALWRVHPRTHEFQIVCEGTSNPYGIAWDPAGSAIVEACHWANDHLFHFVETGHYQRQAGTFPPFTIPIGSITDHGHQKTAYCGIVNLDTDAYPPEYRERICVGNIHGGAINVDRLQPAGATYLARAEPDFFSANDAWCMPVALKLGPDGCLYVLDWYDRYHCSQDAARDPEGVDRLKGRLYRVRYKNTPRAQQNDLAAATDLEVVDRLRSGNLYFRETAQRVLTERLEPGPARLREALEKVALGGAPLTGEDALTRKARLHALWALIGSGSLEPAFHEKILASADATFRAWGARAAGNYGAVPPSIASKVAALARDSSPDVQLQVAIAARKIENLDALPVLVDVLATCGHDRVIPSIAWPNLEPLLETGSSRFVSLVEGNGATRGALSPALATLATHVVERMLSNRNPDARPAAGFIELVAGADEKHVAECLSTVSAKLGVADAADLARLKGQFDATLRLLLARGSNTSFRVSAELLAARLGIAGIDPAVVRARVASPTEPQSSRLQALDAMVAFRDPLLLPLVPQLLAPASFARRALPVLGRAEDSKLAEVLLREYPHLSSELQPLVIDLVMQREPWARKLLDRVLDGTLPKSVLNANHLRKILESNDRDALWAVEKAFGQIRAERNPEREKVVADMAGYFREHAGDPHRGQTVFRNLCAQCHTIHGEGGKVGPDITANGRASFEQLLSNVFDPSLVIGPAYQVTTVVTRDGRNLTGLIAEDNDQRVVVRMPGEGEELIPRNNVKYLRASKLSMMPEGIETLLATNDLTDLFAFLALDKPPGDPGAHLIPGTPAVFSKHPPADGKAQITLEEQSDRLVVRTRAEAGSWVDLATYMMPPNQRPYLHPLRDAGGRVVLTEDRPADHPWQHGIFTGFHRVNGLNYWKEDEGRQRFIRLLDRQEMPGRVAWRALVHLVAPDSSVVLEEEDAVTIRAPEAGGVYVVDFDLLLRAREKAVTFEKFFVGGLAVRMPWDPSNPRQSHLNSDGWRDRAAEQKRAAWCTVERPFPSGIHGIALFDHPSNPNHPSAWRVDEQGLINPNVSGLSGWALAPREEKVFHYELVVYQGDANEDDLRARFKTFAGKPMK